jgi:hypothetical protein
MPKRFSGPANAAVIDRIAENPTLAETPTLDQQRRFYDKWNVENRAEEFDRISDKTGISDAPRSILEVGCGTGRLSQRLGEHEAVTA